MIIREIWSIKLELQNFFWGVYLSSYALVKEQLWIPGPAKDDSWPCLVKIQPCIFKKKIKQLLFTKGPQGPIGATLGTCQLNNFCSSSPQGIYTLHTWLFSCRDDWRMIDVWNLHGLKALWGPPPGPPVGATHTIWTTLNHLPLRMIPAIFG